MRKYSQGKEYKVIAFCISRFNREDQAEHIGFLCRYAKEYGYKVFVFSTLTDLYFDDINDHGEKQIFSLIDVSAFDAIVIMPETFKSVDVGREIADRAIREGVPVISVDRQMKGCTCIDFTYKETFEAIVRHVVEEHGCRRVNYIGGDEESKFSRERFDAYKKVLKENGIPFEENRTGYGNFRDDGALEVLERFLLEEELPQAIICANDTMAIAVCDRLKELSIQVPEDVLVTGFDGIEIEKYHDPRLTTASYDWDRTAKTILELADQLLQGKEERGVTWIPHKMQIGHSCGCQKNYVYSAAEKLFAYQVRQGIRDDYMQKIANKFSASNACETLRDLIAVTEELVADIHCREYWLCFREEIWQKISEKESSEEAFEKVEQEEEFRPYYKEGMICVSHLFPGGKNEGRVLGRGELITGTSRVLGASGEVLLIPLNIQGLFVGYIAVTYETQEVRFDFLYTFCMNVRTMIESYWSRAAQEQLMSKDELTGLYNEKGYKKKIRNLFAGDAVLPFFTLIIMDIDDMKFINDCYGHGEGDAVIRQVGKFIEQAMTEEEFAARIDGDEFVVASLSRQGRSRAQEIQDFIERRLADYNLVSGKSFEVQISIGSYSADHVDYLDYETIDSQADKEMYLNKHSHKKKEKDILPHL